MGLKRRDLVVAAAGLLGGLVIGGAGLVWAGSQDFQDLPADHWAAPAVHYLQARGLLRGYPDQTFRPDRFVTRAELAQALYAAKSSPNVLQAPRTEWNADLPVPQIDPEAFVSPGASVVGDVQIERLVFVAPGASVRGDEGRPVAIKAGSNVQDGAIIHGLENSKNAENRYQGPDGKEYSVYVGKDVSLAHGVIVHGPAIVGDGTFLGFRAVVLKARLGQGVFVGHGAMVIGVSVADNKFIPNGAIIDSQEKADALPERTQANADFAAEVIHVNHAFAEGYRPAGGGGGH